MTSQHPNRRPITLFLALLAAVALVAAACGGASEDGSGVGVASLEDVAAAEEPATEEGEATLAADEAALEFSECMRAEGLDFPDIGVDAEGNPDIGEAFQNAGIQPGSPEFGDAIEVCGVLLEGAGFGGGRAGLGDNTEVQDALIEFSDCLRDQGLDVGDIQLGGGNGGGDGAPGGNTNGEDSPPQGQRRGDFGDRSGRIANALDLDPDDPEVQAALEACNPILDSAFANFGPNATNNPDS